MFMSPFQWVKQRMAAAVVEGFEEGLAIVSEGIEVDDAPPLRLTLARVPGPQPERQVEERPAQKNGRGKR